MSLAQQTEVEITEVITSVVSTDEHKSQQGCSCDQLSKELAKFKQEIKKLKEVFVLPAKSHQTEDNYSSSTICNMQMKIKQLETERSTLIATIEILLKGNQNKVAEEEYTAFKYDSYNQVLKETLAVVADCNKSTQDRATMQPRAPNNKPPKTILKPGKSTSYTKKAKQQTIPTENRYAILQDTQNNHKDMEHENTTVIVGDSMVKRVQGWKIGKKVGHRVVVKAFPGATAADMKHYLKPTLSKKPQRIYQPNSK